MKPLYLAAITVVSLFQSSAFAFDAPSGSYGEGRFRFQNGGRVLTLLDRTINATYQLNLSDSSQVQPFAPEFSNSALMSNPEVRLQRQYLKSINALGVEQLAGDIIRATVRTELGFKTIAGDVTLGVDSPVLIRYAKCDEYDWWHPYPHTNRCINVDVVSARLVSFHSSLGESINQAIGMIADVAFQIASATNRIPVLNMHYHIELDR